MAKADMLSRLINTLTKAEKRYFRLFTSLQQGNKDYVNLFDLMERQTFKNAAAIKETFLLQHPGSNYEVSSKYLYKILLDCLLHLRLQRDETAIIATGILKSDILFERSLHEEALKQLQKMQTQASERENTLLLLWAKQQEIQLLNQLNFPDLTEHELTEKQTDIQATIGQLQHYHQHTSLYEVLRHRLLYQGMARTVRHQEALDELVTAETKLASETAPAIRKTHLLFEAHYFLITGDYTAALQLFHDLEILLETHAYLFDDTPADHLLVIEGILDSLRAAKLYKELHSFLDKVRRFKNDGAYFEVMIQRLLFIYELGSYIDSGNFPAALTLQKQYASSLQKNMYLLDIGKQAEIYLYQALVYLGNDDINHAHNSIDQVLQQSSLYSSLPIYRTFRLVHLLIQYELGNYEYIRYETRAFRRHLQPDTKRSYLLERTVIKFLSGGEVPAVTALRLTLWKKINSTFDKIRTDKYERQQLKLFDFSAWIEAKLKKKPLGEILKDKYEREL
jgi:phage pi2 protein 07